MPHSTAAAAKQARRVVGLTLRTCSSCGTLKKGFAAAESGRSDAMLPLERDLSASSLRPDAELLAPSDALAVPRCTLCLTIEPSCRAKA